MRAFNYLALIWGLVLVLPIQSTAAEGLTTDYMSSAGTPEKCVVTTHIPGGDYSKKDSKKEQSYCLIDFLDPSLALCPKTWSTSPGTMVYDLSKSTYTAETYEASRYCGRKSRGQDVETKVKFKQTMHAKGTSGTYSNSSLLYYHFSRYFDTKVTVPVAVYREMDKDTHRARVSKKGLAKSKGSMIKAGWRHLVNAEADPKTYRPTDQLFTPDRKNIWGVLLKGKGERYGAEFNGTRASGWGAGQSRDFQKTPGFMALRIDKPLVEAITEGVASAKRSSKMRSSVGADISNLQVVYWMRELTEITLMDYIFNQQDRVGNIDYRWYWYWVENGEVSKEREARPQYKDLARSKMKNIPVPEELVAFNPTLVQRTDLNDNDAGARTVYANFTKRTKMLNNLHHYSTKLYTQLMNLDKDLQSRGEVYQWLNNTFNLSEKDIAGIVENTHEAAEILRGQCSKIRFDLDDVGDFLVTGPKENSFSCAAF
ncbi:MAG: hypothetical protein ACRBBP_00500 [Bdellovibrionales bacterium]